MSRPLSAENARGDGRRMTARRRVAVVLSALLAALTIAGVCFHFRRARQGPPPAPLAARPRNIVLIVIDTLRADHLPLYGYPKNTAPFLSELAASAVVFENAYSTSAWTAPATASLFTSLHPFQHGVTTGFFATRRVQETGSPLALNRLPDEVETLGEAFARAGYTTLGLSANINIGSDMGFSRGFETFDTYPAGDDAGVLAGKLRAWKERMSSRPTFLYVHLIDPHAPYRVRRPWFERPPNRELRKMAAYDSEIRFTDERLREMYVEWGWDQGTFLIITSDHGEEFDDHGGRGHGQTLYREMLHVPLIVRPPGGGPPRRVQGSASLLDVMPTLREVAGLARRLQDQGISLLPAVKGGELPRDRVLLGHLERKDQGGRVMRSISDGTWKTIDSTSGPPELFHLPTDRLEKRNRLGDSAKLASAMRAEYLRLEASSRQFERATTDRRLDDETIERLRALGYAQ